ncbi:MAG TPA: hypothetical protein VHF22_03130 [Planctomycetota bacterium]|nr:hypothetical protein [Planctomycetota bacterium]
MRPALFLLALVLVLDPGCRATQVVPPAIGRGARMITIHEFADPKAPAPEQSIFYNLKTEEGRREAERAAARRPEAPFTLAIAHNVAVRLNDVAERLQAAGLARPLVRVITRQFPQGLIATGSASGSGFAWTPPDLQVDDNVNVFGEVDVDVPRAKLGEAFERSPDALLYPQGTFAAVARVRIERLDGPPAVHVIASLDADDRRRTGLGSLPDDPRAQLIARIADMLAYHEARLETPGAPLAFVADVKEGRAIVVDVGLERRTLHVGAIPGLEPPLPANPTRADLAGLLLQQYVRIRYAGGPAPPQPGFWLTVEVEEPPPPG